MRLIRFIREFRLMRAAGERGFRWSLWMCIRAGWRRSHPQAEQRFKVWLNRMREHDPC
jgi:hypothetical protein